MKTEPNPLALLLKPRDAARALGMSERSLFELTRDKKIPSVVVGKNMRRYSVKALEKWIETLNGKEGDNGDQSNLG